TLPTAMNESGPSEHHEVAAGTPSAAPLSSTTPPLSDRDALFEHNIQQINLMKVAAGSMVKGLIMELARGSRDTHIRLRDPDVGGHGVSYDFVRGDRDLVGRIGRALGFASVTDDRLEVRRG